MRTIKNLIVGGGHGKGIGLVINSDLISGRTAVSDTFENRILRSPFWKRLVLIAPEWFRLKNRFYLLVFFYK